MKGYNGSKTSESIRDLWQTPKFVFDYYNNRFNFKVDLAASINNHLCETYFTEEDSAFNSHRDSFGGAVYVNPPYSETSNWVDLCIDIANQSLVPVVMLIPADTSVKWFKMAFENCTECHFISGRLAFINAETQKPVSGNNKGSVVFIFDPKSPVKQSVHLIDRDSMK